MKTKAFCGPLTCMVGQGHCATWRQWVTWPWQSLFSPHLNQILRNILHSWLSSPWNLHSNVFNDTALLVFFLPCWLPFLSLSKHAPSFSPRECCRAPGLSAGPYSAHQHSVPRYSQLVRLFLNFYLQSSLLPWILDSEILQFFFWYLHLNVF